MCIVKHGTDMACIQELVSSIGAQTLMVHVSSSNSSHINIHVGTMVLQGGIYIAAGLLVVQLAIR